MSTDLNVYVPRLNRDLIPKLTSRLADFGMECEFHPGFAFDQDNDSGFLPIRMKVRSSDVQHYIDTDIMTGFEIFIDDFDYGAELEQLQSQASKTGERGFLGKLFGKQQTTTPTCTYIANKDIDEELKQCHKQVTVAIHASPTSEFRTGMYFAAILAELTHGIIYDPQAGEYIDSKAAMEGFPKDVSEYEKSVSERDWNLAPFESWKE